MSFGIKLYKLRANAKMSQEELAEALDVSRQTIRKWENDSVLPETAKLIKISKLFGVSIDSLIMDVQNRMTEELMSGKIEPSYESFSEWEFYGSALLAEYRQSYDEGLDIEKYRNLFEVVSKISNAAIKKELSDIIQRIVLNAPKRSDYKYVEPSALDDIKMLRKSFAFADDTGEVVSDLEDKIHGAWLGRICGCMLGKTVEGIKSDELANFLKATDNYPMNRYITRTDLNSVNLEKYKYNFKSRIYADEIDSMPIDDDTNYTVLAQLIFDKYGADFTPDDVAREWINRQPKEAYCTAERVAFCNFIKGYRPPNSAIHENPYREWIGAQIRADYWGYINPGNPEKAAEMAWRDASISHVKNGIYGAMFSAAMISTAAETSNAEKIILAGLAQIPENSRLYEKIMYVLDFYRGGKSEQECFGYIHAIFDENNGYDWCHTISNAMIVAASLLYGGGNFGKSICMAVETGFDTDCNGATVGSILGMARGINCIDKQWSKPINNKVDTSLFGIGKVDLHNLVEKTLTHINQMKVRQNG